MKKYFSTLLIGLSLISFIGCNGNRIEDLDKEKDKQNHSSYIEDDSYDNLWCFETIEEFGGFEELGECVKFEFTKNENYLVMGLNQSEDLVRGGYYLFSYGYRKGFKEKKLENFVLYETFVIKDPYEPFSFDRNFPGDVVSFRCVFFPTLKDNMEINFLVEFISDKKMKITIQNCDELCGYIYVGYNHQECEEYAQKFINRNLGFLNLEE